ncbi:hypothetical protein [Sulfurimonas sp.]|uniref:hypothetical protein n=1 Tax=Sulfurimonas sp. TaxID=2022749 RepID=UPI0025FECDC9|nr:hypothetical protein [Sulfurimonas sp.]
MKILFIFIFLLSSLYSDEAQRIETIIKDIAQLRGDYEKCQAKLQSKESLSAQSRSYVAPKIKEDSSKSRELLARINKLEKTVKEQEKLLKTKENRINNLINELKICSSKANTEQKKHKNELEHQKNIAKIENFKFANREQSKEKIAKKEQQKVLEKTVVQNKTVKKEQPKLDEKVVPQKSMAKKEQLKSIENIQPKESETKKGQLKLVEKTLPEEDVLKKLQDVADKHRPENSSKKVNESIKSSQLQGVIKFEPTSFRLNARSSIFNAINGIKVDEWEKDRTFTSNQKTDNWIKITGYFIDRKWQSTGEQMWIREKDVFKKNISDNIISQNK